MTKPLNEKKQALKENNPLSIFLLLSKYIEQSKEKEFLKDIGLKKKKKISTYLDDWDVFLKALIDIEININIIADFCNITEILINILPEIKKITNNLEKFIYLSRTYHFLQNKYKLPYLEHFALSLFYYQNIDLKRYLKLFCHSNNIPQGYDHIFFSLHPYKKL